MIKNLRVNKNNYGQPELRTKTGYMGDVTNTETISKRRNILIAGGHHSGKSKAITKLFECAKDIWVNQARPYAPTNNKKALTQDKPVLKKWESVDDWEFPEPVMLNGITPLSKWVEHKGVKDWYELKEEGEYKKVPAWKRVELIPDYLKETRAILFIDDGDRLTGRKLQIAKACMHSAFRIVIACSDENKLSPSIRRFFLETKPQILRLNTDVAYDATHVMTWAIVLTLMTIGLPELAVVLGFMETMKGGRRGSKQN